jgi:hypothetical protein
MEKLMQSYEMQNQTQSFSPEVLKIITDNEIKETLEKCRGLGDPITRKCAVQLRLLKKLGDREEAKRLANKRKSSRFS